MLTLGIDTSTEVGAFGLVKGREFLGEINLLLNQRHSERIMINIKHLLQESEYKVKDLEGLAVTLGPGSFTGLRIGVTTARTMAQFLEIPLVGISTLDSLACNVLSAEKKWILPVIDASRKRVYTSLYKVDNYRMFGKENNQKEIKTKNDIENDIKVDIDKMKIWEEQALSLNELFSRLKEEAGKELIYLTGNGVNSYFEKFSDVKLNFEFSFTSQNFSRGSVIAKLGYQYLKNGQKDSIYQLTPNYLKKAQATLNR